MQLSVAMVMHSDEMGTIKTKPKWVKEILIPTLLIWGAFQVVALIWGVFFAPS